MLLGSAHGNVYIGTGVITENSIIAEGASVINSVKIQDCFCGEAACQLLTAYRFSLRILRQPYMSNGEVCAALAVHSTLLIIRAACLSAECSRSYNAGSAPTSPTMLYRWDLCTGAFLERGSKTASGAYLPMPATLGSFQYVSGKLMHHPQHPRNLPLPTSLPMATRCSHPGQKHHYRRSVPRHQEMALGVTSCGGELQEHRQSLTGFTYSVGDSEGKKILENLRGNGDNVSQYLISRIYRYRFHRSTRHQIMISPSAPHGCRIEACTEGDPAITPPASHVGVGRLG